MLLADWKAADFEYGLDYNFGVSNAYQRMVIEPWNMSTEQELPRHVSRLKDWSKRRINDSENTYMGATLCQVNVLRIDTVRYNMSTLGRR